MTLGVAVIGFGVMGRTHAAAFKVAGLAGLPVELRAICSRQLEPAIDGRTTGNLAAMAAGDSPLSLEGVRTYQDADQLFMDADIDAVSITTWTETHVPLALAALSAGKHVLVEKPVALTSSAVKQLATAVPDDLVCMPAFCMRFWPGWPWLRDRIRDQSLGKLARLELSRVGEAPGWAREFYGDPARSGGALFDLHIHDADFVRWCLGDPSGVASTGTLSHVTTTYRYPDGPVLVSAEGGHLSQPGFGFHMRYRAEFEAGVADFYHARSEPVLLTQGGETRAVPLPVGTAYEIQARHFVEQCLGTATEPLRATMDDAVAVTRLLEREAKMIGGSAGLGAGG